MNKIEHLIISNKLDYSTDLICYNLSEKNLSYLRINRDQFTEFEIKVDIDKLIMDVKLKNQCFQISNETLKSIYFRAPVFYRTMNRKYTLEEQVYRSQWGSFIRNLTIFDKPRWINNPVDTYRAESKLYQLKIAKECNLDIPKTIVSNFISEDIERNRKYIIKSIDTAYFITDDEEMFTYSSLLDGNELMDSNLNLAPIFIQEYIFPKIDIRVTVVGKDIYAVKILDKNKEGIKYDWRKSKKDLLIYETFKLPNSIEEKILKMMKIFNLNFAGIDLILSDTTYYFIEINPTGEWGWLASTSKISIDKSIVKLLVGEDNE